MAVPYFELITGAELTERRDYAVDDITVLDPAGANPIVEGEWLELNPATRKLRRATGFMNNWFSGQFWGEKGRTDTRAISKLPIILWGNYEAYTKVFNNVAGPNKPTTLGQKLTVNDVLVDGLTRKGLYVPTLAGQYQIVGHYFGPGRTQNEIRFMRREPFMLTI
jgi:hypothetical protein